MLTDSQAYAYCSHMDMLPYRMVVSRSITTAVQLSGLTVSAVAEKCGMSRATIQRVMRGERDATVTTIFKIAAATNTNPARLLDGSLCKECITK